MKASARFNRLRGPKFNEYLRRTGKMRIDQYWKLHMPAVYPAIEGKLKTDGATKSILEALQFTAAVNIAFMIRAS